MLYIFASMCSSRFEIKALMVIYTKRIYDMNQQQLKYDYLI